MPPQSPTTTGRRRTVAAVLAALTALAIIAVGFVPVMHYQVSIGGRSLLDVVYVTGERSTYGASPIATYPLLVGWMSLVAVVLVVGMGALTMFHWRGRPVGRGGALIPLAALAWACEWTWFALAQPTTWTGVSRSPDALGALFMLIIGVMGLATAVATVVTSTRTEDDASHPPVADRLEGDRWIGRLMIAGGVGLGALAILPAYATAAAEYYVTGRAVGLAEPLRTLAGASPTLLGVLLVVAVGLVALGVADALTGLLARPNRLLGFVVSALLAFGLLFAYETVPGAAFRAVSSIGDTSITAGLVIGIVAKVCLAVAAYRWLRVGRAASAD